MSPIIARGGGIPHHYDFPEAYDLQLNAVISPVFDWLNRTMELVASHSQPLVHTKHNTTTTTTQHKPALLGRSWQAGRKQRSLWTCSSCKLLHRNISDRF